MKAKTPTPSKTDIRDMLLNMLRLHETNGWKPYSKGTFELDVDGIRRPPMDIPVYSRTISAQDYPEIKKFLAGLKLRLNHYWTPPNSTPSTWCAYQGSKAAGS